MNHDPEPSTSGDAHPSISTFLGWSLGRILAKRRWLLLPLWLLLALVGLLILLSGGSALLPVIYLAL